MVNKAFRGAAKTRVSLGKSGRDSAPVNTEIEPRVDAFPHGNKLKTI